MSCAAWNGRGDFSNDGITFKGDFKIIGAATDWEGAFRIIRDKSNRTAILADYIYYPHGQKYSQNIKKVKKTFYM